MTFKWQGRTYDTSKMSVFETGNPAKPVVYVLPGEVFVVEIERLEGIEIRLGERDKAMTLAQRHGFSHLLADGDQHCGEGATPSSKAHALIVEDDGSSRHALSRLLHR